MIKGLLDNSALRYQRRFQSTGANFMHPPIQRYDRPWFLLILIILIPFLNARAQGVINYQVRDLTNTVAGEDRWEISYGVSGFTFPVNHGFSVFFDTVNYGNLETPVPPVNAGWSVLGVQPDFTLNQPGYYDARALQNNPSSFDLFTVRFVWRGAGDPGSQPFTTYDQNFQTVFAGVTVVPEPGCLALVAVGAGALFICRKRNSHKSCGGIDASQS